MSKRKRTGRTPATRVNRQSVKVKNAVENCLFGKLGKQEKTFNITFRVGDQRIRAHRSVLASASPNFEKMLYGGMKESTQKEVVLKQFGQETAMRTKFLLLKYPSCLSYRSAPSIANWKTWSQR